MLAENMESKAHELIRQLEPQQLSAVVHLLEAMTMDDVEDELSADDIQAIKDSRQQFLRNPEASISFEEMVSACGFSPAQFDLCEPPSH